MFVVIVTSILSCIGIPTYQLSIPTYECDTFVVLTSLDFV